MYPHTGSHYLGIYFHYQKKKFMSYYKCRFPLCSQTLNCPLSMFSIFTITILDNFSISTTVNNFCHSVLNKLFSGKVIHIPGNVTLSLT